MKKRVHVILSLALSIVFLMSMYSTALAENCEYYSPEHPCNVGWYADTTNKMHCRACKNHVEDKEYGNYVLLTEWEKCTLDEGGECTTCGWDYIRDPQPNPDPQPGYELDPISMEFLMVTYHMCMEELIPPLNFDLSGNTLSIEFSDAFIEKFYSIPAEYGYDVSLNESMAAATKYTLSLTGGTSYNYTGSAIKPAAKLTRTEYGPMSFLLEQGMVEIGDVEYKNNVNPGTATASVTFNVSGMDEPGFVATLSTNFTIVGEGGNEGGGNQPGGGNEGGGNQPGGGNEGGGNQPGGGNEGGGNQPGGDQDGGNENQPNWDELLIESVKAYDENKEEIELRTEVIDIEAEIYEKLMDEIDLDNYEIIGGSDIEPVKGVDGSTPLQFEDLGEYEGQEINVFHGKKNGKIETFSGKVKNGMILISVEEFSPFVLTAPINKAPAAAPALPQTGDSSSLMIWLGMMLASGAALMGLRRKASQR